MPDNTPSCIDLSFQLVHSLFISKILISRCPDDLWTVSCREFLVAATLCFVLFEPSGALGLWVVDYAAGDIMKTFRESLRWYGITGPCNGFHWFVIPRTLAMCVSDNVNKLTRQLRGKVWIAGGHWRR